MQKLDKTKVLKYGNLILGVILGDPHRHNLFVAHPTMKTPGKFVLPISSSAEAPWLTKKEGRERLASWKDCSVS